MTTTIGIHGDRDQSVEEAYDCDWCNATGCAKCEGGKVIFRSSKWEMNLANGNFSTLASALGLPVDDCCGSWDARLVLDAIARFRPELAVRATTEEQTENGATIINCGIDGEYVARRLAQLKEIAMEAAKREELIGWG